ncbi:MAG: hypothetical protein M1833_002343 [Piccolia ochrophora]|nr:MAG: hypothetical protein M1833_002343 [Piccolia ochrophora]
MAWGRASKPTPPPPPPSALSKLLPLIVLAIVLGGLAFVGFQIYLMANNIADSTSKHLEKKNVLFTKDGMKVGVKEVNNENYVDQTQNMIVKAWNLSKWPAYKSRFWNKEQSDPEPRKPYSRTASSTNAKAR